LIETADLEESGVTATAIAPAFVDTDMSRWVTSAIPGDTMIRVADVVRVVEMVPGLEPQFVDHSHRHGA
jgi:3-oxoacyl-[acyl-carrier protein] reductase